MAAPHGRGRGPSKGPPAPAAAPAPPPRPWGPPGRLPSIDPPKVWEGRRLASQPSTTSDVSDAPSLLAMGAPWACQALAAAAAAADRSAGAGGGRGAAPAPPPGGGKLQLQGASSLVDAVVNMQPLPTSAGGSFSPALPASPQRTTAGSVADPAAAEAGSAGPAAAGPAATGPAGLKGAALEERPPLLPASSVSSSSSSSTDDEEGDRTTAAPERQQPQHEEPLQAEEQQTADHAQPGQEDQPVQVEAEEEEPGDDGDDAASFESATSGRYLTPGSSVGPDPPGSSASSDGGRSASPQRQLADAQPTWQPLQPSVEPPPRLAGSSSGQGGSGISGQGGSGSRNGSPRAAPAGVSSPRPSPAAAYQQEAAETQDGLAALPPSLSRLDSEGVHAPRPSPASPATPVAPPRPQWQPQAATIPLAAAQPLDAQQHAQQGAARGPGSWPGAPPPWRQQQPPRPLRGAFVPHRRSRLAQQSSADGAGAAAGLAGSQEVAGHPPPPSAGSAVVPIGEAGAPEQQAAASGESRAADASGWAQQGAEEQSRLRQQGQGQQEQDRGVGSPESSSSGESQLTEIRGEWPPRPGEPEAAGPWPASQASSTQLQQEPSLGWGGMRSAFQAAAQGQGRHSPARSPAWRHPDDGSWHEPGGEVDWEAPASPSATFGAGSARTARAAEDDAAALIHDSLVEAASHSPPLSPATTRLLALHRPSGKLRRGPQRAASLGPLSLPERQPSMLSPEGQHLRLASQPSSPLFAASVAAQRSLPPAAGSSHAVPWPAAGGHASSWPSSPAAHRSAPSLRVWAQQPERLPSPEPPGGVQCSLGSTGGHLGGVGGSFAMGSNTAQGSSTGQGASGSSLRPLPYPGHRPQLLPVLNASPDVAGAGAVQPFPASPFRAPSAGGPAGSPASRFEGLGGLPLPPLAGMEAGAVDKRDSRRLRSADLSPREAYAGEGACPLSALRRPLLDRSSRSFPGGSEGGDWEAGCGWGDGARGSNWRTAAALLASSAIGIGLVALPRALSLLGWVAAAVGIVLAVLLAILAHHCLAGASADLEDLAGPSPVGIADVARAVLGPFWGVVSDIAFVTNSFGLMVASLVVAGDILVGSGSHDGLLGGWGGDRATALAVLCAVVVLPLLCFRDMSYLSCSSQLSVTAAAMWAAALLALAVTALSQGTACRLPAFPAWRSLHGGGRHSHGGGWFARTVELLAAVPVLLVVPSCLAAAASPVARQLRPYSATRLRGATNTALLYCTCLAALLAVCACLLLGSSVQADVLSSITLKALAPLAGDPAGPAAFLLIRLAFLVALVAGFPLLMGPFRDALWRVLFWQPLLQGAGLLLVTVLALAGALWACLQVSSLWQLLSALGGTAGALLVLVIPGLVSVAGPRPSGSGKILELATGCLLLLAGSVVVAATVLRAMLFPAPA